MAPTPQPRATTGARRLLRRAGVAAALLPLLAATPAAAVDHSAHAAAGHTAHGAHAAGATPAPPATASASADTAMFRVGTATRPLVVRGHGPLWRTTRLNAPGETAHGSFGARYVARVIAQGAAAKGLTKAQATKKLSKKCRTLVNAKKPAKLSKASKKARTKCLEQRRKIIAESKKDKGKDDGGSTPTSPTAPAPAPSNPAPTPSTPSTPSNPSSPSPTTPTNPAPTGPTRPASCTADTAVTSVSVTAADESTPFAVTSNCVKAGTVSFTLKNDDQVDGHDTAVAATTASGAEDKSKTPATATPFAEPGATRSGNVTALQPGLYKLICRVPGHGDMTIDLWVV